MASSHIKILDIELTPEEAQGDKGLEVIQQLKPDWSKDKIAKKKLSGGFINLMLKYYNEDDPSDGVVFRVYGSKVPNKYFSRESELLVMQIAHHSGCFPSVLAFFKNGVAYNYAPGRIMTSNDFEELDTIRAMARALCGFHNADMAACQVIDRNGNQAKFSTEFYFYEEIKKKFSELQEDNPVPERRKMLQDNNITIARLHAEVDEVKNLLEGLELEKSVCHYDFHLGNCLYNEETKKATVVDFESTKMGYEAFDIGGVFVEASWRKQVPGFYAGRDPPNFTKEVRRMWAREYITCKYELQGRDASEVTEHAVEKMYLEHELMSAIFHLAWLSNFGTGLHKTDEHFFAVLPLFTCEYNLYMEAKKKWPELKARYLAVKEKLR